MYRPGWRCMLPGFLPWRSAGRTDHRPLDRRSRRPRHQLIRRGRHRRTRAARVLADAAPAGCSSRASRRARTSTVRMTMSGSGSRVGSHTRLCPYAQRDGIAELLRLTPRRGHWVGAQPVPVRPFSLGPAGSHASQPDGPALQFTGRPGPKLPPGRLARSPPTGTVGSRGSAPFGAKREFYLPTPLGATAVGRHPRRAETDSSAAHSTLRHRAQPGGGVVVGEQGMLVYEGNDGGPQAFADGGGVPSVALGHGRSCAS